MKPELSIIILNWNTKELLQDCLESILDNTTSLDFEVIVVDNGSTDGSVRYLKSLKPNTPNLTPVFNKNNLGFAKGNNQGIKKAKGNYVLLLNSDTKVKKGTLTRLVNYLKKNPDVAAVGPLLLNPDGSRQFRYYLKLPSIWQLLLYHNILLRPLVTKTFLRNIVINRSFLKDPFEVDLLCGAALMAKKEIFKKTKGLDKSYPFLFEDADWSYRVQKQGLGKLVVVPQAKVIHIGGASWKKHLQKNRFAFYHHHFKSFFIFIKKHYPEKLFLCQLAAKFTFLINALVHLLTLNFAKSLVQLRLLLSKI